MSVQQGDVLDVYVFDDILFAGILSDTAHANTMGVIAPQILDKDICCIWLRRETVITDINSHISKPDAIRSDRVESVSILWRGL